MHCCPRSFIEHVLPDEFSLIGVKAAAPQELRQNCRRVLSQADTHQHQEFKLINCIC